MKAKISNFRMSRHTKSNNQMIILMKDVKSREKASELLNKEVVWKTPSGKEIKGIIAGAHGNKGALRVRFEKGMPGQAIGTEVEVK